MRCGIALLVMFAMILFACRSGPQFRKDGATDEQIRRDKAECEYEAEKYGDGPTYGHGLAAGVAASNRHWDLYGACMKARGYREVKE